MRTRHLPVQIAFRDIQPTPATELDIHRRVRRLIRVFGGPAAGNLKDVLRDAFARAWRGLARSRRRHPVPPAYLLF